jgi:thioredoxin-like negative regulator of GroEL
VLGTAAVILLADSVRRLSSPRAAAVVGVVLAGYSMWVLFDLLILMESLVLGLTSLFLWLCIRSPRARWLPFAAGALIGTMALGRPTALLLLIPFAGLVASTTTRARAAAAMVLALGVVALIAIPVLIHHRRVAREWIPFTYSLGVNLFVGNGPYANGTYVVFTGSRESIPLEGDGIEGGTRGDGRDLILETEHRRLRPMESSEYWVDRTLSWVRQHPGVASRLFAKKLALLFNRRELPQIESPETYERSVGFLGWPLAFEFAFFGVFGLAGAALGWRLSTEHRFVIWMLAIIAIGTATFFIVDRYRIHLIVWLAPLAGVTIEHLAVLWRTRAVRHEARLAAGCAVGVAIVFLPLVPTDRAHEEWSIAGTFGDAWLRLDRPEAALPYYERAIAIDQAWGMRPTDTLPILAARASVYDNYGTALARVGRDTDAVTQFRHAIALAPEARTLRIRYADALLMTGATNEAVNEYRRAGSDSRSAAERLVRQAMGDMSRGDITLVRRQLEAAAELDPGLEAATIPLTRLEIQQGALVAAATRLERARSAGLDLDVYRAHLAWIEMARGDTSAAQRVVGSIPEEVRAHEPRVASTLVLSGLANDSSPAVSRPATAP